MTELRNFSQDLILDSRAISYNNNNNNDDLTIATFIWRLLECLCNPKHLISHFISTIRWVPPPRPRAGYPCAAQGDGAPAGKRVLVTLPQLIFQNTKV